MEIINLTPHDITFVHGETTIVIPTSGNLARVSVTTETIGEVNGIPITTNVYGKVEGLPPYKEGIVYLVSSLVAQRVMDRDDVFVPNDSVRDDNGKIIGCKSLGKIKS